MYRILDALILSATLFATGCFSDDGREEIMLIDHYMVPCHGEGPLLCALKSEGVGSDQTYFYDSIVGFQQEWGHRYKLRVLVTDIPDPPADGSSLRYELLEVLSDEVVDERFTLALSGVFIEGDPATQDFSLLGRRDITCAQPAVCDTIVAALAAGNEVMVELAHSASPAEPLTAHQATEVIP